MKNEISNRDLELLSAYLDQELNPKDKASVELRLQISSELRSLLGELHQNRAALRSLPHFRAPRNFTLSPEIAGIKPKKRTYPVFGLVSALTSLVLILVLVGDFIVNPTLQTLKAPVEQPASFVTTEAAAIEMESALEKAEEAPAPQVVEEPLIESQQGAIPETTAMDMRVEGAPEENTEETPLGIELFSSKLPESTLTPSPEGYLITVSPTSTIVQPIETPTLTRPTETKSTLMDESAETAVQPTPTSIGQSQFLGIASLRILEFVLVVVALLSGLIAIILRSKYW